MRQQKKVHHVPLVRAELPPYSEVAPEFRAIMASGKITNFGVFVQQFEKEIESYLGVPCACVSSGTLGLICALLAAGIKPGDKVIVPSFTFMASVQAILFASGIPIFADIDADYNISLKDLDFLLTQHPDVAAILPVHLYGLPCRVFEIEAAVKRCAQQSRRSISIIYDAAHAFGATRDGRKVGTFGNAEVFSLSATKTLNSVEGGLVCSPHPEIIEKIKVMRNYGMRNYNTQFPGINGKMSEFHAIIGVHNLRRIERVLKKRQTLAKNFCDQIKGKTRFSLPPLPSGIRQTFKDFTILLPPGAAGQRAALMQFLLDAGIETRAYFYPPAHQQEYFRRFVDRPLPTTEDLAARVLTLPFYSTLTGREITYMVDQLQLGEEKFL